MSKLHRIGFFILLFCLLWLPKPQQGSASVAAPLTLLRPANGSMVTSPIQISAVVQCQPDSLIRITLLDRSKDIISRQLFRLDENDFTSTDFFRELNFEIYGEITEGLLTVAVLDINNRPITLRSALLTLQSNGENNIETQSQTKDWLTITQPQTGDILKGGKILVEGVVIPITERPIHFELITDSGGQIGSRQLAIQEVGKEIEFNIVVPYAYINSKRDVRLVILQTDSYYGENIILDSVPIFLQP